MPAIAARWRRARRSGRYKHRDDAPNAPSAKDGPRSAWFKWKFA